MRKARRLALSLLPLLLIAAAPVGPSPEELYTRGDYTGAAQAGIAADDAPGYAVTARALIAEATLRDAPCVDCFHRAQEFARRGIERDASYQESYVQLAASMGYEARLIGAVRARVADYPSQAKDAIDKALMLSPNDPFAMAAAGGWNIEIVRMGGAILGSLFFSASTDDGIALYRKALAADPGNIVVSWSYVLALTSYDFEAKRLEIMAVLDTVVTFEPRDAYSKAMQERAMRSLELLRQDKRAEYQKLAQHYLGFE